MKEGWFGDEHLILFDKSEIEAISVRYAIGKFLPGCRVLGLKGWDDFIIQDALGRTCTIPTVPLDTQYLSPFDIPAEEALVKDKRFEGKIKWHTQPIVFGGDPAIGENMIWVSLEEHAELVRWWNNQYFLIQKPTNKH